MTTALVPSITVLRTASLLSIMAAIDPDRFAQLADEDINQIIADAQPERTRRQTRWGVSVMKGKKLTKLLFKTSTSIFAVGCFCVVAALSLSEQLRT